MQGLESTKHQNMLKAIEQFEKLNLHFGHIISEDCEDMILTNIAELKKSYTCYNALLKELEGCINNYKETHDALRKNMFPYVRKMSTRARNKKR